MTMTMGGAPSGAVDQLTVGGVVCSLLGLPHGLGESGGGCDRVDLTDTKDAYFLGTPRDARGSTATLPSTVVASNAANASTTTAADNDNDDDDDDCALLGAPMDMDGDELDLLPDDDGASAALGAALVSPVFGYLDAVDDGMMLGAAAAATKARRAECVRFSPTGQVRIIPARPTAGAAQAREAAWPVTSDAATPTKLRDGPCPIAMLLDAMLRAYFQQTGPPSSVERLMQLLGSKRCGVIARENEAMAEACWQLVQKLEAATAAAVLAGGAGHVGVLPSNARLNKPAHGAGVRQLAMWLSPEPDPHLDLC